MSNICKPKMLPVMKADTLLIIKGNITEKRGKWAFALNF